jgi:type III secretion system YscQ/HrcQ family protein
MLDLSALPQVDSATARIHQALLALPAGLPVEEAGAFLTWHAPCALSTPVVSFACETARASFALHVESALVERLCDVTLPGWRQESASALPLVWRLTAMLDAVLRATPLGAEGLKVRLDQALPLESFTALGGTLAVQGQEGRFLLAAVACDVDWAENLSRAVVGPARPPAGLRFPAICRLARLEFELGRVRRLAAGDVLLVPGTGGDGVPAHLILADGARWDGRIHADGAFEAIARLERSPAVSEMNDDILMSDEDPLPDGTEGINFDELEDVADLSVALDLQFHRKLVPLTEFSRLVEGSYLDLGIDLSQPVRIRANDCTVGTGHLVQIGDRVGVRIERWRFGKSERPG